MEFVELETGKNGRGNCRSCRRWIPFDQLNFGSVDDLKKAPCPYCGDTGKDLRDLEQRGEARFGRSEGSSRVLSRYETAIALQLHIGNSAVSKSWHHRTRSMITQRRSSQRG